MPEHPTPDPSDLTRLLVSGAQDHAIFTTDTQGRILTWNPGVERLLGYEEREWVGRHGSIIFTPEDRVGGEPEREMRLAASQGRAADVRWHLRKDGTRLWVEGSAYALRDQGGNLLGFGKVMADATERRLADDALRQAEERLRLAAEATGVGTFDFNPVTGELLWDARLKELFGLPPDAPVDYDAFLAVTHPEDRERAHAVVMRALDPNSGADGEYAVEFRPAALAGEGGGECWVMARGRAYFDAERTRAERFVGTVLDITARKRIEAELRERDERFQAVSRATRDAVWDWNLETDAVWWNEGVRDLFGYAPEEVGSDAAWWQGRVHPDDRARVVRGIQAVIEGTAGYGQSWSDEYRFLRADGGYADILDRAYVVRDEGGAPLRMVGAMLDLTERKRLERELRRSEARFRAQADAMPQMVWATDARGNHLYYNRRWYDYTGQTVEQSLGFGFALALHPDDRERTLELWRRAWEGGGAYEIEYRIRRQDGAYRWFVGRAEPVRDAETGRVTMWAGTCTDIDDLKRAQGELERLYEAQRARAEREALINRIGDGIRQSLPPEHIEALSVRALGEALGADRCYVFTVNLNQDALVIEREWCAAGVPRLSGRYRLSDLGIDVDAVFGSGETLVVPDMQGDEGRLSDQNAAANEGFAVSSLVNVPFYEGGRFVGALAVAMARGPRRWAETEVALAETVAGQLRSTVEAARLQQRERNIAEQLQAALQPPPPPSPPGLGLEGFYRPALEEAGVGGDFYDVFPVEKGCTALVVADLSGKGLAAAQQVAATRNMLRFALYTASSLSEGVTTLNRTLVEHHVLSGFATLFAGVYDQNERTLTYVNCGQEPGLLWRAETGEVEFLPPTGPVLGGFEGADFGQEAVSLRAGDVFALITDGLTEVGPNRRKQLEIGGVSDLFRDLCAADPRQRCDPKAVAESLIAGVDAFAGGGRRDDIALLVGVVRGDDGDSGGRRT